MAGAAVQVRGGDDDVIDDEFHGGYGSECRRGSARYGARRYSGGARARQATTLIPAGSERRARRTRISTRWSRETRASMSRSSEMFSSL